MEAKLKAEELFNKYCYAIRTEETDSQYWTNIIYAKNCALICINEMISICYDHTMASYYGQVRTEIEKL